MAISGTIAAVGALGAGVSAYQGEKMRKAQKKAGDAQAKQAEAMQRQSEREFNKLNQKQPNIAVLQAGNRAVAGGGPSGSFLTGPSGAPVTSGLLGRTTLLGG
jgi:uncharacterized protein HemX